MQRTEGEMASFRDCQSGLYGFQVPHFADEHYVRVLTQNGPQGMVEALRVLMDLPLIYDAGFVLMRELYRVLYGDNVLPPVCVDLVDHRGQSRGFPGPSRSCHQNEPPRLRTEIVHDGWKAEFRKRAYLIRDESERSGQRASLHEDVSSEPTQPSDAEGEVQFLILFEAMLLNIGENAVAELRVSWGLSGGYSSGTSSPLT